MPTQNKHIRTYSKTKTQPQAGLQALRDPEANTIETEPKQVQIAENTSWTH